MKNIIHHMEIEPFDVQSLLDWYNKFGRKTLPWQINKTPYKIWISEIMLQQTKVKTVISYFNRFICYLPTVYDLAFTSLNTVLHLWSGLGYYNRARNLHTASQIIINKHNGYFPNNFEQVISLPGIGKSTAGAILSLAFDQHYPILDGNVKRIIVRYYFLITNISKQKLENNLWKIVHYIIPKQKAAIFNQAMMDLGSMICIPITPKCSICPIHKSCKTYINQNQKFLFIKKQKKVIEKKFWFLILQDTNYVWLEQRILTGIWEKLFCFPQFDTFLDLLLWLMKQQLPSHQYQPLTTSHHTFSHFRLKIIPILIKINRDKYHIHQTYGFWYNLNKPAKVGLAKPIYNLLLKLHTL